MEQLHVSEIFNRQLLELPEEHEKHSLSDIKKGKGFRPRGGIYVYKNNFNEPLYVGISANVSKRAVDHMKARRGNKDLYIYAKTHRNCTVTVYYEDNAGYREVYESYLIDQLQPRYNVAKTGRMRLAKS